MSTPATDVPSTSSDASPPKPVLKTAAIEKLIGAWRRFYLVLKPLEAKVDATRAKVVQLLVDAGVESFVSKHGKVSLQRRTTVHWEQLARDTLKPEFIAQLIERYSTTSSPFTRAPAGWSGEAK